MVAGWLGQQDVDRAVGCVADASFLRDLATAAAADLENGATEPDRDGADYERLEVTGRSGTAWMADDDSPGVVRLAIRLVEDVHQRPEDRGFCRETPETTPGDPTGAVVLTRRDGQWARPDEVLVTTSGSVTGRTEHGLVSCQVPASAVEPLSTAPVPADAPPAGSGPLQMSVRRAGTTHDLEPLGDDPLSAAARTLLDDVRLPAADRTLCTPRR